MSLIIDGGIFSQNDSQCGGIASDAEAAHQRAERIPFGTGWRHGNEYVHDPGARVRLLQQPKQMDVGRVAGGAASALLRDARGNSGVILSLLFRGMSKSLKGAETCTGAEFAAALAEGRRGGVQGRRRKPAEGTILTVSRLAAAAAVEKAEVCDEPEAVLEAAVEAAKRPWRRQSTRTRC